MDRITERTDHGITVRAEVDICVETPEDYKNLQYILSVLAAYEDSDLDSEEIESITFCGNQLRLVNKIEKLRKELRKERKRWHKVSDGDLPPEPKTGNDIKAYITVCKYDSDKYHKGLTTYSGTVDYTYGMDKKWWQEHCAAWMELPEYEEDRP